MRLHSLPVFVRLRGANVILAGTGDAADAKRRLLERAGAVVTGEDQAAQLAIVAIDDDVEAEAAVARLKARGILVNAVDRIGLCDFTLPAIVDRDPVLIAIGTGGASAGLAKALRQRLEALLPQSLGSLAMMLSGLRATLRDRFPDPAARRRAIDEALAEGGALDPLSEHRDAARAFSHAGIAEPARIETIILASIDPDDLTLRHARLLGQADRLYCQAGVPAIIIDRARADAVRIVGDPPDKPMPGLSVIVRMA